MDCVLLRWQFLDGKVCRCLSSATEDCKKLDVQIGVPTTLKFENMGSAAAQHDQGDFHRNQLRQCALALKMFCNKH